MSRFQIFPQTLRHCLVWMVGRIFLRQVSFVLNQISLKSRQCSLEKMLARLKKMRRWCFLEEFSPLGFNQSEICVLCKKIFLQGFNGKKKRRPFGLHRILSFEQNYLSLSSMINPNTSPNFRFIAAICWGIKLVEVMPGVVLTSRK